MVSEEQEKGAAAANCGHRMFRTLCHFNTAIGQRHSRFMDDDNLLNLPDIIVPDDNQLSGLSEYCSMVLV